ncbi:MAG TPA: amidase [Pseudolabrys sp.]|nr:amidase [Pseudolabrys sp.]
MTDDELWRRSTCELASLIRERKISPRELLDSQLSAIGRFNPKLNAIVTLAADQAREAAIRAEQAVMRGATLGALHGIPIGVKDVTPTAGIRTTYGSPLFKDNVPAEDAEVVSRLKAAGAIVLAKTNTPEFAAGANTVNPVFGATRNPWNTALSPAGSSGGSAAAVASGMLPIAQGTDFGCSIRIPAAFCGIVGIRPTPGLTPNYPMRLGWDPGQVHGPLARNAEDAALFLDAIIGFTRRSPISVAPPWSSSHDLVSKTREAKGLRIAFARDIAGIGVDTEIETICRRAAEGLRAHGAAVEEIAFDLSAGRDPYKTWRGVWMVGQQFRNLPRLEEFGENLRGNVKSGLTISTKDIAAAEEVRIALFQKMAELFDRYDVLMTPAAPVKPYPVEINFPREINGRQFDNYIDWIAPAFLITLLSLPAASVPAGLTADNLPAGLQIIGPRFDEPRLLGLAKLVASANPIGWPPISR